MQSSCAMLLNLRSQAMWSNLSGMFTRVHHLRNSVRHLRSGAPPTPLVCIVGSGPAAYYTALKLLGINESVRIDMYEKLPTPFGLVRYGVAPDHPEVKAVIKSFTTMSEDKRFRFVGNVNVGRDVSIADLQKAYHVVVMAYGSDEDKKLGIPGEEHILSAQKIVGWYNGTEDGADFKLNLDAEEVAVIGHGNVALDVSRLLLMKVDDLKTTDITPHALEALSKSRIKCVHMIGRRGPMQSAFTIAEVRELIDLPGCDPILNAEDFHAIVPTIPELPRPKKRLMQLLADTAMKKPEKRNVDKKWYLKYLRSPLEVTDNEKSYDLKLAINTLDGDGNEAIARSTGRSESLPCQMIIRSAGYLGIPIDPSIPFDNKRGIINNDISRVKDRKGIYCSGWIQSGPIGVLLSTRNASFDTAQVINYDIKKNYIPVHENRGGYDAIDELLRKKSIQTVSFSDWLKIDQVEKERGERVGKPREKILKISEMLQIARS